MRGFAWPAGPPAGRFWPLRLAGTFESFPEELFWFCRPERSKKEKGAGLQEGFQEQPAKSTSKLMCSLWPRLRQGGLLQPLRRASGDLLLIPEVSLMLAEGWGRDERVRRD